MPYAPILKQERYWARSITSSEDVMKSINYFFYMHGFINLIISVAVAFVAAALAAFLTTKLGKLLSLSDLAGRILTTVCIMAALFGSFFGLSALTSGHNQGGIQKLFILDDQQPIQLTLWLTRIHSKRVGANYDHLIKTFDLESGRPGGMAMMVDKHYDSEYYIYRESGEHAWGKSGHTGIQYLDLRTPRVIYNDELIQLNPRLKQGFDMTDEYNRIDPVTGGLRIETKDRMHFQIDPDLKLKPPALNHKSPEPIPRTKWYFHRVKGSLGYNLHAGDTAPSQESALLLKPEVIEELNPKEIFDTARWIAHPSALYDIGEPLISYISADGTLINRIELKSIINKKARGLNTYSTDTHVYVFITSGETFHANIKGFTLMALKTDKVTGEIVKQIEFF